MEPNILIQDIKPPEKNLVKTPESRPASKTNSSYNNQSKAHTEKNETDKPEISDFQKKINEIMKTKKKESPEKSVSESAPEVEDNTTTENEMISANLAVNNIVDLTQIQKNTDNSSENATEEGVARIDTKIIAFSTENKIAASEEFNNPENTVIPIESGKEQTDNALLIEAIKNQTKEKPEISQKITEPAETEQIFTTKETKPPETTVETATVSEKDFKAENKLLHALLKDTEKADTKNLSKFFDGGNEKESSHKDTNDGKMPKGIEGKNTVSKGSEFSFQPSGRIETGHNSVSQDKSQIYQSVSRQIEDSVSAVLSSNKKEIKIDMSPPDLGNIKIEVVTHKNKEVAITIMAKDSNVKSLLDNNKNDLINNMSEKGVLVKEFSVSVGGNNNRDQNWRNNFKGKQTRNAGMEDSAKKTENVTSPGNSNLFISFDGKVDFFA